jgi:CheY-like chemotaxis protein
VLTRLVGNAVKFTETGEIVVSVDVLPDATTPLLRFSVRDTGISLDAEQIAGLFSPFAQIAAPTSPRHSGSGLGLAVCKRIVEQMGGVMSVESQLGRDTVFSFTIALQPASAANTTVAAAGALANRRVLIVDDNASTATILFDMLSGFGMTPQTVTSGVDALVALHMAAQMSEPFDMVLMDWRMPGMDGLELARRIRSDETLGRVPALLMATAHGREAMTRRLEQLNLQGLLIKPVTETAMLEAVQAVFAPTRSKPAAARTMDKAMALLAERRVLVVDDNAPSRELTSSLLELAGVTVDTAASGSEALERLSRRAYDAVLMDMQMPGMAGRETTRRIRRNPAWTRLPVIAVTDQDGDEDRNAGASAGMTARLAKPIDEARLYRTLADIFIGTSPVEAIVPPDFEAALRRLNGDHERLERLLRGFLRDFADIPAKLGNLIGTDDLAETGALAQLVKTAAGYMEARQLMAAANALEQATRNGDHDIDALAEHFRRHLQAVLNAIGRKLAGDSESPAPDANRDRETALALIDTVEPLLARGDYAADPMLKQLAALLDGRVETAMIDAVRSAYAHVELPRALASLARLKAGIAHG